MEKIVSLKNVSKTFPVGKSLLGKPTKFVHAVNNVSFDVFEGETFSIVGESGCGKSTTGRIINHLLVPARSGSRARRSPKSARTRCVPCARTCR